MFSRVRKKYILLIDLLIFRSLFGNCTSQVLILVTIFFHSSSNAGKKIYILMFIFQSPEQYIHESHLNNDEIRCNIQLKTEETTNDDVSKLGLHSSRMVYTEKMYEKVFFSLYIYTFLAFSNSSRI